MTLKLKVSKNYIERAHLASAYASSLLLTAGNTDFNRLQISHACRLAKVAELAGFVRSGQDDVVAYK
jgi:hypothetical protein